MPLVSPPHQWLLSIGAFLLLSAAIVLAVNKRQREAVLGRLRLRLQRRRASAASTPPRSIAPPSEKAASSAGSRGGPDYSTALPPSRRCALADLVKTVPLSAAARGLLSAGAGSEPSDDFIVKNALPTTLSYYSLDHAMPKYTPTGFSTAELKAMGDFPAYDVLSGVPLPKAYENFDLANALPRPYRPFRWKYHQTMSFHKMEPDWWLEVENSYTARIKERQELFREYGSQVLDYLPGSELACKELMEMCLQFYCARYPGHFALSADKKVFHNRILGTETVIRRFHPLHILLAHVPEDFAVVLRSETDGRYYFRAGVICSSLGWHVGTKIGLRLDEIHRRIPDYREKMAFSMDRFFSKMATGAPIQRGSWGLEVGSPLFVPPGHPHEALRETQDPALQIEECRLRVDWQTLRRLPLSAAVVFNFKALFTPVTDLRQEPYIPALLLTILREGKRSLMEYKGTWHTEHVCIPKLEEYAREQVAKGWVVPEIEGQDEWNVATLAESPFFPGWEAKWHRQQGF
ncbi:uncharacterized protein L3040_009050 [Drepanopeziza brunnea f. sp. 'multigermtubi']|uniref:uncharacterized protein n=1 Tax=Drepanopeziza brunnea f. sp. 'multigermtubi' TaxID=698441 RepID=UPI002396D9CA|nr:hypothetical protein L3040_009050 [Drepanopeziza brunnea f. sp. 'multigermtubi']